jgi:fructose-1,6-bisphosphatase/inositol monophosphatase family enzyme
MTREPAELGDALVDLGRRVRDIVRAGARADDGAVVRSEGGDEVFGADDRAEVPLWAGLRDIGSRWPGTVVMEGFDEPVAIGDRPGEWRYIIDPLDGTRPWIAGKRSAWVLFGAGRGATTLTELEVSAVVEVPTSRAALGLCAWATNAGLLWAIDDDLAGGTGSHPVTLTPRTSGELDRAYVSVQRFVPGQKARIGVFEDELLHDLETYEDPYLCSGGQLMEVALGREAAALDARPLLVEGMAAHPYDLAGWLVAAAAGVIVEALPPGPLAYPLDTTTPCAWAAYANEAVAEQMHVRLARLRGVIR